MNTGTQVIQKVPPPTKMLKKVKTDLGSSEVFSKTSLQ